MITNSLILPIIIPLATAIISLAYVKSPKKQSFFTICSLFIQLVIAVILGVITYQKGLLMLPIGGWAAPFGITLTVDLFSIIMIVLSSVVMLIALLFNYAEFIFNDQHALKLPLLQFLAAGLNLAFSTGDLFNLFVAYEVILLSSYSILTLTSKDKALKNIFPYVVINLTGSALFLVAAAIFYGLTGTLNFADIAHTTAAMGSDPRIIAAGILILTVFAIKAGFFPMYYWLPNSYPMLPPSSMGFFSAILTELGIYSIIRFFGTVMPAGNTYIYQLIMILAVPTMLFGALGALSRKSISKILCFQIIGQIGFMMVAFGDFSQESISVSIFYIIHHVLVIASLIFIAGIIKYMIGSDKLSVTANMLKKSKIIGLFFLIQGLSLAGLPPFSGFWAKYLIISNTIKNGHYFLTGTMILASVLTLVSMLNIWLNVFWKTSDDVRFVTKNTAIYFMKAAISILILISLSISIYPEMYIKLVNKSAKQVLDKSGYQEMVLGR
jgi:multicomponent Na+:H+ antiporter subunit D